MSFCDVIVPGPWWNSLTYELPANESALPGSRISVPVGRGRRIGWIEGVTSAPPEDGKFVLRKAGPLLDPAPLLAPRMLSLLQWGGKTFLCGTGEMIQTALPGPFLSKKTPVDLPGPQERPAEGEYREFPLYLQNDGERWARASVELGENTPFLALFPEQTSAEAFHASLPLSLREKTLLWPSTGGAALLKAWRTARGGEWTGVVGGPGAVFAPLPALSCIFVDEESSGGYRSYKWPYLHSRTLAGRRARLEGALLLLGGRIPSSRLYLRCRPKFQNPPRRGMVKFVDMKKGIASESPGVSGTLPLTAPFLEETQKCLEQGRTALWLLDRKGYAGEVACEECGNPVWCKACGSVMAWEERKGRLRCSSCGALAPLPEVCPICRGVLLRGKRPGLEALYTAARSTAPSDLPVLLKEDQNIRGKKNRRALKASFSKGGIVAGTRSVLSLCDLLDVGFAGWIDADAEARRVAFQAKFTAYSMAWESLWRGNGREDRVLVLQSRRPGSGWQKALLSGWEVFWRQELKERKELDLPPFFFLLEVKAPSQESKESIMAALENGGLVPMDPGDPALRFWVSVQSLAGVAEMLAPFYSIGNSTAGFPEISVWID